MRFAGAKGLHPFRPLQQDPDAAVLEAALLLESEVDRKRSQTTRLIGAATPVQRLKRVMAEELGEPAVAQSEAQICQALRPNSIWPMFFTWDVIFAGIWGLLISVPLARFLAFCFKKQVLWAKHTEQRKKSTLSLWRCQEMLGWFTVLIVHVTGVYLVARFVRIFPWPVVERWMSATLRVMLHRFVVLPLISICYVSIVLSSARSGGFGDCLFAMNPQMGVFKDATLLPALPQMGRRLGSYPPRGEGFGAMMWARVRAHYREGILKGEVVKALTSPQQAENQLPSQKQPEMPSQKSTPTELLSQKQADSSQKSNPEKTASEEPMAEFSAV